MQCAKKCIIKKYYANTILINTGVNSKQFSLTIPDISLSFGPYPGFSLTAVNCLNISRFFRKVVTCFKLLVFFGSCSRLGCLKCVVGRMTLLSPNTAKDLKQQVAAIICNLNHRFLPIHRTSFSSNNLSKVENLNPQYHTKIR